MIVFRKEVGWIWFFEFRCIEGRNVWGSGERGLYGVVEKV